MDNKDITKAVLRSQHCQRNWDLSKEISPEDLKLIEHAATQCPSKQNLNFYALNFITDRDMIESIHAVTKGFGHPIDESKPYSEENHVNHTNSQTLANLLVVIEYTPPSEFQEWRNIQFDDSWKRDADMAIGICAGYLNLTSSLKGYRTGCCACFDGEKVKEILGTKNDIALMMGIGIHDETRARREHHATDFVFPSFKKETVKVKHI